MNGKKWQNTIRICEINNFDITIIVAATTRLEILYRIGWVSYFRIDQNNPYEFMNEIGVENVHINEKWNRPRSLISVKKNECINVYNLSLTNIKIDLYKYVYHFRYSSLVLLPNTIHCCCIVFHVFFRVDR